MKPRKALRSSRNQTEREKVRESSIPSAGPTRESPNIYRERALGAIAARWDAKAAAWERVLASPTCHLNEDDAYLRFFRLAEAEVARRRHFCRSHGVIDLGCGTGLVLERVLSAFAWGVGVDISPKMIRVARKKRLSNARFVIGDGFDLAQLSPPAGAIFSRGVLLSHYGSKQGEVLLQSARHALVPGGFVMCDFLNRLAAGKFEHQPQGKMHFKPQEVFQLAERAGYQNVRVLGESGQRVLILLAEAA